MEDEMNTSHFGTRSSYYSMAVDDVSYVSVRGRYGATSPIRDRPRTILVLIPRLTLRIVLANPLA